jgi:hypothetical protein
MVKFHLKDGERVSIHGSDAAGTFGSSVPNFELPAFASAYLLVSQE